MTLGIRAFGRLVRTRNLRDENGGKLTLYYSCKIQKDDDGNALHFGVPKVIFGVWNRAGFPYVDREGTYGMCEHAGGHFG